MYGQTDRGTITGTVTDPAGAVVANAPLVLLNTNTGNQYQAATSETGNYTFGQLPIGNYTLTQPTTTANITGKVLTVSGVTAANKVYDGPNRICDTTASGDDEQVSDVGTSQSNTLNGFDDYKCFTWSFSSPCSSGINLDRSNIFGSCSRF